MRFWVLIAGLLMASPAFADYWSGDDVGYGRPQPGDTCYCDVGDDGIDWTGGGTMTPPSQEELDKIYLGRDQGPGDGAIGGTAERGHGSSDGGRGPDRHK